MHLLSNVHQFSVYNHFIIMNISFVFVLFLFFSLHTFISEILHFQLKQHDSKMHAKYIHISRLWGSSYSEELQQSIKFSSLPWGIWPNGIDLSFENLIESFRKKRFNVRFFYSKKHEYYIQTHSMSTMFSSYHLTNVHFVFYAIRYNENKTAWLK